jgi:hypothetical protein
MKATINFTKDWQENLICDYAKKADQIKANDE